MFACTAPAAPDVTWLTENLPKTLATELAGNAGLDKRLGRSFQVRFPLSETDGVGRNNVGQNGPEEASSTPRRAARPSPVDFAVAFESEPFNHSDVTKETARFSSSGRPSPVPMFDTALNARRAVSHARKPVAFKLLPA